jgi:hypothetical protein
MTCSKGHLFCKSCVIENLLNQKREIKKRIKIWEEGLNKKSEAASVKDNLKKIDYLKKAEDGIEKIDSNFTVENIQTDEQLQKSKMFEDYKDRKKNEQLDINEKLKECFWAPEFTPEALIKR